jgi:transposase
MEERVTPEAMKLRRQTVEHPFATIKYRIFGHPRLLVRGLVGAKSEIAIATMAYNLKRITKVLGGAAWPHNCKAADWVERSNSSSRS